MLVRFLVRDDAAQTAAADALLRRIVAASEPLFVPITVALELEWVLRTNYGFAKADVARTVAQPRCPERRCPVEP